MTKVAIIATGGTIASQYRPSDGEVGVGKGSGYFSALVADRLPGIAVETHDFSSVGSYMLTLQQAFDLVCRIREFLARDDIFGVVVTHGTDTLEETAFMADLLLEGDKPVVFTGSQKPADDPESDGPRNVVDAVTAAASPRCGQLGVVVVFEQEIHAARDVTKVHTSRVGTFGSAEHGKLGEIDHGDVFIGRLPSPRRTFPCAQPESRIDVIKLAMGVDARFLNCALDTGARAIVLEAFGRGNVTPDILEGTARAVMAGVPVIVTSRCPQGRVLPVYAGSGGAGLAHAGAIFAGDLSAIKARILLSVLLGKQGSSRPLAEAIAAISR